MTNQLFSNNQNSRVPRPFRALTNLLSKLFNTNVPPEIYGEPLNYSYYIPDKKTRTSLEPQFSATRTPEQAYELENLKAISGDVQIALRSASTDVFSSQNGDVVGFSVSEFVDDENTVKVDPDVLVISKELFARKQNDGEYVIGGDYLSRAVEEFLLTGDSFLELIYNKVEGKNEYYVSNTRYLPVWEMFCVVDEKTGLLSHYEQRRSLHDSNPIHIPLIKLTQFCFRRKNLYGQGIFPYSAIKAAKALDKANDDIQSRSKTMSENPDVFTLPEGYNLDRGRKFENYIRNKQAANDDDLILLMNGMTYQKGADSNPDLSSHLDYIRNLRMQIVPGGFPLWYFPDLSEQSKDLMGQPSAMYARFRNKCCGVVARGVREILDNELILRLGAERYLQIQKNGGYKIEFPEFIVNPNLVSQYDGNEDIGDDGESSNKENLADDKTPAKNKKSADDGNKERKLIK